MKNWLTNKITREKLDTFMAPHASSSKTLEVGSWGKPTYGRYFPNRTGLDIRKGRGVDVVASVYEMPFGDEAFDIVLCMSVLEHLEEPKSAVKEMHRVLKTGGKIIVGVPFMFPIHESPHDYWRFTKYGLLKLFSDGWDAKVEAESSPQESVATIFQRLGFQTDLNPLLKLPLFLMARALSILPTMTKTVFGDYNRQTKEPDAFSSGFFLTATKK